MVLWETRSYTEALTRERARLLARCELADTHGGLAWRWRAPRRDRVLYRLGDLAPEEFDRRIRSLPGIGVWTSAEVRQRALGDPDAVSFGDYHLANHVGWALFGHDITDEEMAEALEPYRPQRGRAAALACAGGQTRPRRGPRMSLPTHLPTRGTGRRTR